MTLCGGEPLLLKNLNEYVSALRPKKIILNTNASLLPSHPGLEQIISGVDIFGISIDGPNEAIQTAMRGPTADLAAVVRTALMLKQLNKHLKIATVATRQNISSIPDMIQMIKHINPDIWRIYQFASRSWRGLDENYSVNDLDFAELITEVRKQLEDKVQLSTSERQTSRGCFIVDHHGNYLDIHDTTYVKIGNVASMSVIEAWNKLTNRREIATNKRWLTSSKFNP